MSLLSWALNILLRDASKLFANSFSCGAAVVKGSDNVDKIDVQGDVKEEIVDLIISRWNVPEASIFFIEETGGKKIKVPAKIGE